MNSLDALCQAQFFYPCAQIWLCVHFSNPFEVDLLVFSAFDKNNVNKYDFFFSVFWSGRSRCLGIE